MRSPKTSTSNFCQRLNVRLADRHTQCSSFHYHAGIPWPMKAQAWNHRSQDQLVSGRRDCRTITAEGVFTAAGPGTWHVVATSAVDRSDPRPDSDCNRTRQPDHHTLEVTLYAGQKTTFKIQEPAGDNACTWTASSGSVVPDADPGALSGSNGVYQAPSAPGTYLVSATSVPGSCNFSHRNHHSNT